MKMAGLLIVFLCCLFLGTFSAYKTKQSLVQLRCIIDFTYYIKSQIEHFSTPINEIYMIYARNDSQISEFVNEVSKNGWEFALDNSLRLYFSSTVNNLLKEFGAHLGKSNKADQATHCDYYIQLLENEYSKLEKDVPQKTKVSLALGLSGGILLVILLI